MKNKIKLMSLTLLVGMNVSSAFAGDLVFICHKGMNYTKNEVKLAFKGQLDEPHMVDNSTLKSKLLEFVGVDSEHYRKMWNRSFFRRALNQPQTRHSDAEVIDYVASHGEGIGYVSVAPSNNSDVEVCGK